MRSRSILIGCLILALTALAGLGASRASADDPVVVSQGTIPYGVYVQNPFGMALPGVTVTTNDGQTIGVTNPSGLVSYQMPYECYSDGSCGITGATALYGSRSDGSDDPCEASPEGWPGVLGKWTDMGNGYVMDVITLPVLPGAPYQPALSNEERGLVGLINQTREAAGLAPVTISTPLTASADKYLGSVPARKLDYGSDAIYCENSNAGTRAVDAGFPTNQDIGESVLQGDANAAAAFTDLQNDPNQDALTNGTATLIGIAQENGTWVIDTSDLQTNVPYYGRAGDTGDVGDASLVAGEFPPAPAPAPDPAPSTDPGPASRPPRDPHLSVSSILVRHGTVHAKATISTKAQGTVTAIAVSKDHKKAKVALRVVRRGSDVAVSGRLLPGKWVVRINFVPKSGTNWTAAKTARRVTVHAGHRH